MFRIDANANESSDVIVSEILDLKILDSPFLFVSNQFH